MKKVILLGLLLVVGSTVNAQNTFPSNGNVGIGTTNPTSSLHIKSSINQTNVVDDGIALLKSLGGDYSIQLTSNGGIPHLDLSNQANEDYDIRLAVYHEKKLGILGGNVGIGASNPTEKLQVNGNISAYDSNILLVNSTVNKAESGTIRWNEYANNNINKSGAFIKYNGSGNFLQFITNIENVNHEHIRMYRQGNMLMQLTAGNIGVGIGDPTEKLQVNGNISAYDGNILLMNSAVNKAESGTIRWNEYSDNNINKSGAFIKYNGDGNFLQFITNIENANHEHIRMYRQGNLLMQPNSGNVGIGTTTPDAKLTVKGNIHTQEVKVDLNGAVTPDYVFKEDYNLKSLAQVQEYINENGHLPNIPSATEMEKEGMLLKEMNLKLLEKIEELTLYTIQQQKEIEANRNIKILFKELKNQNTLLIKRLEALENK